MKEKGYPETKRYNKREKTLGNSTENVNECSEHTNLPYIS